MTQNATDIDCFVIGSGPSLTGFDFSHLPPATRIGANKSAWLAECDILVTIDRYFPKKCRSEIEAFDGEKIIAALPEEMFMDGVTYVRRERGDGFSNSHFSLRGLNSGFAALNLAYLRGFKNVALLGFDFKWDGSQSHFHDGYVSQNKKTPMMLLRWAQAFDRIANLVNCTNYVGPLGSNVTAFPTRPLEELYG